MLLAGDGAKLYQKLARMCPELPELPKCKRQLLDYQMAALYVLAQPYNLKETRILEIGTGCGGSGYMLAKAAPLAEIVSLTVSPAEKVMATLLWKESGCKNIIAVVESSWDYGIKTAGMRRGHDQAWDMVFVDGDHNHIAFDLPWFNRLTVGGLFLCHDYTQEGSKCPSQIVYSELNKFAARLGRPFDVSIIDDGLVGMVGFYRREGETA